MAIPLYQDLWNGKETLSETVALRCGEKQLTFGDFFQDIFHVSTRLICFDTSILYIGIFWFFSLTKRINITI